MIAARPCLVPETRSVPCIDQVASSAKLSAMAAWSPAVSASRYLRSTIVASVPG
jgi:hypothetical protein